MASDEHSDQTARLASLCALEDATRRRLYDYVVAAGEPVNRDQASAAVGVERSLAAYHLDRLAEDGLLATSFARAAETDGSGALRGAVERTAAEVGRELAADAAASAGLVEHLARLGFEPYDDGGVVRLRNCPFHQLARAHTELVCGLNLAMLTGLAGALEAGNRPRLDPAPGRCCVAIDPA